MVILQAIVSLLSKLTGKVLNAIFGWAVVALFGRSSPKQQMLLTGLVGAAAAWPLLLAGIAFPKVAALVLAFVPFSKHLPSLAVRLVWLALALAVPVAVGLVVASKAPPGSPRESFARRVWRGFPITVGIAGAFLLMFLVVPALRVLSMVRGRQDEHVPMLTTGAGYDRVASMIDEILQRHGLEAKRTTPSWWLMAPSRILGALGGAALRGFMPEELAYWLGPGLELALYPSDLLIRGAKAKAAWAHGVLAEGLTRGPGLQTLDAKAQEVEQAIRRVWAELDKADQPNAFSWDAARERAALLPRLGDIALSLAKIAVPYDDWQVLYRETLQLDRALHAKAQLLDSILSQSPAAARAPQLPPPLSRSQVAAR
jgi:hypothetical protein